jgi:N-acetylglucosaminyldiphosphoundecaprenol N-acetyl-beta-D-mannosaminyltransferase
MERPVRNAGKLNVLGILIDAVDYEAATEFVFRAAAEKRGSAISALAVHGLMTGAFNREQKFRLNHFDLLTPDGQPVKWAMNLLYKAGLKDRVYGPKLTLKVCERAEKEGTPIYFYGSERDTLALLRANLAKMYPNLRIAGMEPSKFRRLTAQEKSDLAERINGSGASIVFVGLGCPKQEMLAVGAAFPFLAGKLRQAPPWMQAIGLEWLFRLLSEPKRLWRRYVYLNPAYLFLLALQALRLSRFGTDGQRPVEELSHG